MLTMACACDVVHVALVHVLLLFVRIGFVLVVVVCALAFFVSFARDKNSQSIHEDVGSGNSKHE